MTAHENSVFLLHQQKRHQGALCKAHNIWIKSNIVAFEIEKFCAKNYGPNHW